MRKTLLYITLLLLLLLNFSCRGPEPLASEYPYIVYLGEITYSISEYEVLSNGDLKIIGPYVSSAGNTRFEYNILFTVKSGTYKLGKR